MVNMVMKFIHILFCAVVTLVISSCKDTNVRAPISDSGSAPGVVTDVEIENIPGGAVINYTLPNDNNPLYVKGVFENNGTERVVKSSVYKSTLTVNGFADTTAKQVKLYTVSRGEAESKAVEVTINPLTPPLQMVAQSMEITTAFGGVKIDYTNDVGANMILTVLAEDSLGEMQEAQKHYSKDEGSISFFARGFDPTNREFGLFVQDEWDNRSDTLFVERTPLFEERIPKDNFSNLALPTDDWETSSNCCPQTIDLIWDDIVGVRRNTLVTGDGFPQWFSIDLGVKARFSRFKMYHRMHSQEHGQGVGGYRESNPKEFELWGSNDPNPDGSWDSWTKIASFSGETPSGNPNPTASDIQYAVYDGEDFLMPNAAENQAYRYIRFKTNQVWGNRQTISIAELTFWGEIIE